MRILILTPWSFRRPRNGGQLRAAAIVEAYQAAGHDVHWAGIYDPNGNGRDEVWPTDIAVPQGVGEVYQNFSTERRRSEMSWWLAVALAAESFNAFAEAATKVRPDILQFEEMALWPVVRRLQGEGYLDGVTVIHSSYNFETTAWRHRSTLGDCVTPETLLEIAEIEREIAADCDLIVTVSEGDAQEFRRLGAANVCVAPNGVDSTRHSVATSLSAYLPDGFSYALFVSSAHPPNAHGIVDLAAGAAGHPLQHGEILVCGKVGALMKAAPQFGKAARVLDKCRYLGWVDDAALSKLYEDARVVILPKMYSGGSNLKTAEALASGRPIVATRLAFEGFEHWADLPNIAIADDPDEFWRLADAYLATEKVEVSRSSSSVEGLQWRNCLKSMVHAAGLAFAHGSAARSEGWIP